MTKSRLTMLYGAAVILGFAGAGCATRGYVRSQVDDLRAKTSSTDDDLRAGLDRASGDASQALTEAAGASSAAEDARGLALGHAGLKEAQRFRVYFAFDSAKLSDEAHTTLDQAVAQIKSHLGYLVDLYGFADPTGTDAYNFALGERRADAVRRYLLASSPGQLSRYRTISFGEKIPASEAATIGEKEEMRRQVVVSLVERTPLETPSTASAEASPRAATRADASSRASSDSDR
jgi:outer membrane protein OmpA-like peptidoglycan-associated protein